MKSGYKESLDQYKDLVNQPTWADSMGDAFSSAGKGSAKHPEDHQANALLSGVGGGLKGAANEQRREQLSPMLEQAGQITAKAAEIEAQTQIATQSKMQVTQLFQQTAVPIAQLSQASLAGDINASNQLAKGVYARFKQGLGDAGMGDFDHYHNGTIYYENPESGVIEGRNIVGLMYQAGINPLEIWGQDAPMIEAGLSAGAKKNYENTEQMRQLEMQGKQADVANKYSQVNYHNAQTGKLENEMNNPEKPYNKEVASHNLGYIKEQRERKINAEALVATLNDLEGFIETANKKGQAGSDIRAIANRASAKYWSGDNEEATLADMAKAAYFARVKEGGGSNPSTTEFLSVLETVPNIDKNPKAALARLKFDREQALKQMYRFKKTEQGLRESQYQGSPDDESVFKHDDNEYKDFSSKYQKEVKVQAPDGTIMMIPKDKTEEAIKRGGIIIE